MKRKTVPYAALALIAIGAGVGIYLNSGLDSRPIAGGSPYP
jgi:hypothetical protein